MKPLAATALDRLIAAISPDWAVRRMQARMRFMMMTGGYTGGKRDRRQTKNWLPGGNSADADLLPDLQLLRERSRDLNRNAPLARGAVNTMVTNVVGIGLKVQPQVDRELLGLDDESADRWERDAERAFGLWTDGECDITRTGNFYDLQALGLRSALESGDVFVVKRWVRGQNRQFGYALQIVEADRICNPDFTRDGTALKNGNTLAGGVERDRDGAPVAYYILEAHPGALDFARKRTWSRMPAFTPSGMRTMLHVYAKLRPDQARGEPYLAPVLETFKMLDRYSEAELTAAVLAAMFTVFIKTSTDEGLSPAEPTEETGGSSADSDYRMGPGAILTMRKDQDVEIANPGRPNASFDPFVMSLLRHLAAALELPLEVLIKHFTSSYSASRGALLEAWKVFKSRRVWLGHQFCSPCYEDVITEAVGRGLLQAPGFFDSPILRKAWLGHDWVGPAPGQLDPTKEIDAAEKRVNLGVSTLARETAELTGGDWERNHTQRVKEIARQKADGIYQAPQATRAALPAPDPEDGEDTKGGDS